MSLKWQLSYTVGYMQLGMYQDAARELDSVPPEEKNNPDVLAVAIELHHHTQDWEKLMHFSKKLMKANPFNPGGWVSCAFALRRLESIEAARDILKEATAHHAKEPLIHFNLGCYAAQLGELDEAEFLVRKAIEIDPSFKKIAQEDEDLEPLRDNGLNFS